MWKTEKYCRLTANNAREKISIQHSSRYGTRVCRVCGKRTIILQLDPAAGQDRLHCPVIQSNSAADRQLPRLDIYRYDSLPGVYRHADWRHRQLQEAMPGAAARNARGGNERGFRPQKATSIHHILPGCFPRRALQAVGELHAKERVSTRTTRSFTSSRRSWCFKGCRFALCRALGAFHWPLGKD